MALEKGVFDIYFAAPGDNVRASLAEAQSIVRRQGGVVTMEHSDIRVEVAVDSDLDLLLRDWGRGQAGCLGKYGVCVPSYPSAELSAEEEASDQAIREAAAQLKQLQSAAYNRYHHREG